jgi:hypothetical protein
LIPVFLALVAVIVVVAFVPAITLVIPRLFGA